MLQSQRALIGHLYRRFGFGATAAELRAGERRGYSGTIDELFRGLSQPDRSAPAANPPTFQPFSEDARGNNPNRGEEFLALSNWWIDRMAETTTPLKEKLTLLLHCQFPTAYYKVNIPSLLFNQNLIFRELGHGSFSALTMTLSKDPAMLIWLDTGTDLKSHPNENFARELMERFTMGIGNYSEDDVKQAARAFTGWLLDYRTGQFVLDTAEHDYGMKTFLGHSGTFTGDQIIEIVTHTKASSHFVVSRLWSWLAYPVGPHNIIAEDLAPGYASDLNIGRLLRAIAEHPNFVSDTATSGLIKQPVEYVVGALRAFKLSTASFPNGYVVQLLNSLGQQVFNPPTVGGWGNNQYWLSTSNSLMQLKFARLLTTTADLSAIEDEPAVQRVDALAELLGLDSFSAPTTKVLDQARHNALEMIALALISPDYVAN